MQRYQYSEQMAYEHRRISSFGFAGEVVSESKEKNNNLNNLQFVTVN